MELLQHRLNCLKPSILNRRVADVPPKPLAGLSNFAGIEETAKKAGFLRKMSGVASPDIRQIQRCRRLVHIFANGVERSIPKLTVVLAGDEQALVEQPGDAFLQ